MGTWMGARMGADLLTTKKKNKWTALVKKVKKKEKRDSNPQHTGE
jgi:hypothetical protein